MKKKNIAKVLLALIIMLSLSFFKNIKSSINDSQYKRPQVKKIKKNIPSKKNPKKKRIIFSKKRVPRHAAIFAKKKTNYSKTKQRTQKKIHHHTKKVDNLTKNNEDLNKEIIINKEIKENNEKLNELGKDIVTKIDEVIQKKDLPEEKKNALNTFKNVIENKKEVSENEYNKIKPILHPNNQTTQPPHDAFKIIGQYMDQQRIIKELEKKETKKKLAIKEDKEKQKTEESHKKGSGEKSNPENESKNQNQQSKKIEEEDNIINFETLSNILNNFIICAAEANFENKNEVLSKKTTTPKYIVNCLDDEGNTEKFINNEFSPTIENNIKKLINKIKDKECYKKILEIKDKKLRQDRRLKNNAGGDLEIKDKIKSLQDTTFINKLGKITAYENYYNKKNEQTYNNFFDYFTGEQRNAYKNFIIHMIEKIWSREN